MQGVCLPSSSPIETVGQQVRLEIFRFGLKNVEGGRGGGGGGGGGDGR